jgi:predicted GNAT family N-acyltransferase
VDSPVAEGEITRDAGPGCAEGSIVVRFDGQYATAIRRIRNRVFTGEQHIDEELDFDGQDPGAVHVLVACHGEYVGTGRMLSDGHIGRLAVLKEYRGRGLGVQALLALVAEADRIGLDRVYLGAQKHAVGFYERLGFSVYGEPYMEVGIEHVHMQRTT